MLGYKTVQRAVKKVQNYETDKLFAYFVGLLGLSAIIYTYLNSYVISSNYPDILYVDKETLQTEKGGRYAVLLKRASKKNFSQDENEFAPKVSAFTADSRIDIESKSISSDFKFVIPETKVNRQLKAKYRTATAEKCQRILDGDSNAQIDATLRMSRIARKAIDNLTYRQMTSNCSSFINNRGYINSTVTEVERDFPLAFSIIAYKQVEQIERLLRAIYRPQNFYCVHLDNKTVQDDVMTMTSIAHCFPNVFMSSRSIDVRWGEFSVLEAEIVCMEDLWKKKGWKYFINLTGQEFPLKTNLELVKILRSLKGANVVDGTWVRARQNYFYRWTKSGKPPPQNIRPIKGSVHVCINRDFVDFALHDFRSKQFLQWLKETEIPDETFFASLNHNPALKIHGSFLGEPEEYPQKPTFTRYKNWEIGHGVWARRCSGKYVHNICILGVGDLPRLKNDISLFANKFHIDYQYMAYDCIEEFIYQKTRDQYLNKRHIDVSFYEMLDQVKLRYVKPENHKF